MKNGFPQIRRSAFAHYIVGRIKFTRLSDSASRPAKAASFLGLSNLEISPISLRMATPVTVPIPVMAVIGDSSFPMMQEISASVSVTCFLIKEICSISDLGWNVKLFLAKVTPKEEDAAAFNCSAFAAPTFCLLSCARSSARVSDETDSKSIGEENWRRISFEVLPKMSEKMDWYPGNT